MIEARGLTKRYGPKTAVDRIDLDIRPGAVTGFLGPNGAGKSTTMRMIVGLDRPSAGTVTVAGRGYRELAAPLTEVGALLDGRALHPSRSARDHLRALAATHGIPRRRVDEVIELTGIGAVARQRAGKFSLGMTQRLGIAAALLGDPAVLVLDEPVNGLDPEGVRWVRTLVRSFAAEGRTVLLSSHLMSEMAQTADRIIVLGRGRVLADAGVDEVIASASGVGATVRSPDAAALREVVERLGGTVTATADGALAVSGVTAARIGDAARDAGLALHELVPMSASLEEAYLQLTDDAVEYRAGGEESR